MDMEVCALLLASSAAAAAAAMYCHDTQMVKIAPDDDGA
jgi:hypothetical protein